MAAARQALGERGAVKADRGREEGRSRATKFQLRQLKKTVNGNIL